MSTEIQGKKQWDARTGSVTAEGPFGTAIREMYLPELHKRMEELGVYKVNPQTSALTYPMLKALVSYLNKNGYDASTLNESVGQMLADAIRKSIVRLQTIMNSIVPPDRRVAADGAWNSPAQQGLYSSILQEFGIPFRQMDSKMTELIETIASRVVRVRSTHQLPPVYMKPSYYFIIDNSNYQYELKETGNEAILIDPADNRELIRLNILGEELSSMLERFYPWFLLLNLKSVNDYNDILSVFLFSESSGDFGSLQPATKGEFIIDPDGIATEPDFAEHLRLSVMKRERSPDIDLVGIYFFSDYSMRFAFAAALSSVSDGEQIVADPEHFFYIDAANVRRSSNVLPLGKADFLKIFIIKKNPDSPKTEGVQYMGQIADMRNLFNLLVTLEKDDLLGTVTIGLQVTEASVEQEKQKQKPVLTLKQLKETVEQLLQSKPVIDFDDIQKNRWGGVNRKDDKILTATVSTRKGSYYPVELYVIWTDPKSKTTGNVAFILHNSYKPVVYYETVKDGMATFSTGTSGPFTVGAYTDDGTELELDLNKVEGAPKNFYYHEPQQEFKDLVLKEYRERPILVPDDLQKGRWGAKSETEGFEIKASVRKTHNGFTTTVTIDATKSPDYNIEKNEAFELSWTIKEAALFLHNSFDEEILHEPFVKGKAQFTIYGDEAFTLGAMTNTGVFLELDLNEVKGFPADFYYEYASNSFVEEVGKLQLQLPLSASEPIQKGKELSAEFVKLSLHGVTLHLKVKSENRRKKFAGEVAFFLPSTYNESIIYKTVFDGESLITIDAEKAFIAHAYTSDGAMLSLDLNTLKELPESFYGDVETGDPSPPFPPIPFLTPKNIKNWGNATTNFISVIDNYFEITNEPDSTNSIKRYRDTTKGIQLFLEEAIKAGKPVKAVGSGWSYSSVAVTDGWLLDTSHLTIWFKLDKSKVAPSYEHAGQLFFVQCGSTIKYINDVLARNGHSLKTTTASAEQTLVGAISTGSHGSAIDFGSMQDFVVGLHIITGSKKHVYIERLSHPVVSHSFVSSIEAEFIQDDDLFNAALVSLGAFGIIHGVMIETEPVYLLEAHRIKMPLNEQVIELMNSFPFTDIGLLAHPAERPFHLQVFFNHMAAPNEAFITTMYKRPYSSKLKYKSHSESAGPGDDIPAMFSRLGGGLLHNKNVQLRELLNYFTPLKKVMGTSEQFFNNRTVLKGSIATAMGFPAENTWEALNYLMALVVKSRAHSIFFSIRFVKKSQALLAFTKFETSCILEIDAGDSVENRQFFETVWKESRNFIFPITYHWGKLNDITPDNLKRSYGENLDKWITARKTLLPEESLKLFSSPQLREWGLT